MLWTKDQESLLSTTGWQLTTTYFKRDKKVLFVMASCKHLSTLTLTCQSQMSSKTTILTSDTMSLIQESKPNTTSKVHRSKFFWKVQIRQWTISWRHLPLVCSKKTVSAASSMVPNTISMHHLSTLSMDSSWISRCISCTQSNQDSKEKSQWAMVY